MDNFSQFNRIETDESLMETAKHGTNLYPFHYYYENISLFDFNTIDWHWHTELEFIYIESGDVLFDIGEEHFNLNAGNGIMINSKVLHRIRSYGNAIIPNFLFLPTLLSPSESLIFQKYVSPIISSSLDYIIFQQDIPWQAEIIENMKRISYIQKAKQNQELEVSILIQKIWLDIYNNTTYSISEDKSSVKCRTRLQLMMQFIQSNYNQNIMLKDIADSANLSKSSALHLFNNYLKVSPITYLINYRLSQSAIQLVTTEKNVETIALDTGFTSCEYFCKTFKKYYGQTPTNYRKTKST